MAKNRFPATNALVEYSTDGGTAYNPIGVIRNFTLPPQVRSEVDLTGLEDPASVTFPGIEQSSSFTFEEVWDPLDTHDAAMDSNYTTITELDWKITVTDGTNGVEATFKGRISALEPQQADATNGVARQVTVLRSSVIAYASTP